jgi:hypothetical protein
VALNRTLFRLEVALGHAQDIFKWISNGRQLLGVKLAPFCLCFRDILQAIKRNFYYFQSVWENAALASRTAQCFAGILLREKNR